MKLFIWKSIFPVSSRYHAEGGVAICAENLEHAKELWLRYGESKQKTPDAFPYEETFENDEVLKGYDAFYEVEPYALYNVYVFPNAGCC